MANVNHGDDHLSIIPYDQNRDVVLRNNDTIVVFDQQSRQLILRNRNRGLERPALDETCPHCGRPYTDNTSAVVDDDNYGEEQQPSFINQAYFRMLADSVPGSSRNSAPPSPRSQSPYPAPVSSRADPLSSQAELVGSAPAPPNQAHPIPETAFSPGYFEKFFVNEGELGRGGRGVVMLVRHVLNGMPVGRFACKRVPVGNDHAWLEKVLVEVHALQGLAHQNLVSYRHVWLQDFKPNSFSPSIPNAFILQQYCNAGDLHTYVCGPAKTQVTAQQLKERIRRKSRGESEIPQPRNEARKLHFDQIYKFFLDITEGLRYLHQSGFIHRDLKPSNCLLNESRGVITVLVSDFGEVQYENTIRKSTGHTGTISYCAPEVLRPVSPGGPLGNFTFKSDVFSLGMILHFLCFADLPYLSANVLQEENEDLDELRDEITSWIGFDHSRKKRPDLPGKLYLFLERLLSITPDDRPTAEEVLSGARMGGLEFIPDLKRRGSAGGSSNLNPDNLTPARGRITKVESPHPIATPHTSSPSNNKQHDPDSLTNSRELNSRRRGSRRRSLPGSQHNTGTDSPRFPPTKQTEHNNSSAIAMRRTSSQGTKQMEHNPSSAIAMRRTSSQGTNGTAKPPALNTQLRPHAHVTSSQSPTSPLNQLSPSPEREHPPQQLLLPSSDPPSRFQRVQPYLRYTIANFPFYILLFAAKVLSVMQPCLNGGINSIVFYPTFALALFELAFVPHPFWRIAGLSLVHVGILWYAKEQGLWCQSGIGRWREFDEY